ncbi:hypothetical protein [Granulicella tundricola]|uniref:Uncharacterized protein n=1 Tax=Granulicella tundricola (strain ATCC BAA-1859 / DSM 23138 / MP5ACTX9) TaxID=1198114 RepID=E8WXT7_GRATM|nr:hypothetical protein [Granulicella tundricola]ADW69782.1 hypothetical protein AciX9_2758 [Granulicella tundricola MP5ACTX9]
MIRPLYISALALALTPCAQAQLLGQPPLVQHDAAQDINRIKRDKKAKSKENVEWLWQYSPPPADGREHDLIQDPNFLPFLDQYFTAPQSFWGTDSSGRTGRRKSLAETAYDFLTVPGKVWADNNRYITATGSVFHLRTSRGLLFVDLNGDHPLAVFAAIDWIRDSKTTDQPDAEYTLWLFPNHSTATSANPAYLPGPLIHSLTRWMAEPVPGTGIVQKITAAIVVDPDGTPHQIAVPTEAVQPEGPTLPKRK